MKKILIITASLFVIVACGSGDKKAKLDGLRAEYAALGEKIRVLEEEFGDDGSSVEKKAVQITEIVPQEFVRRVIVQGTVDGDEIIAVHPRSSGEVVMLRAVVGQQVQAGQVLAKIDDKILRNELRSAETSYEFVKTVFERQAALWKDSIGSEIDFIKIKNEKESIEFKIASLKEQINLYQIVAPISGKIERVDIKMGQMASPQMPAIVIINVNKLKVKTEVSEAYSDIIGVGDRVNVSFPDINQDYDLAITSVSNFINTSNRTFALEVRLPANIEGVKANMLAKISIESYKVPNALIVPINVIFKNSQGEYLFVVEQENGKSIARKCSVKTGVISENNVEILEGLSIGASIVTIGYQTLEDGIEIEVI